MPTSASPASRSAPADKSIPVSKAAPESPARLVSLDAYRGFVMLAMVSGGFAIANVAKTYHADSPVWQFFGSELEHVKWVGCSAWDLIQPSFMFMVGVALPYSHASRRARGESRARIAAHVVFRSIVLILLGIFLVSNWGSQTNFTFVNVLTQIGLGYCFVYLFRGCSVLVQLMGILVILGGYYIAFAAWALPAPGFDYRQYNVSEDERFPDPRGDQRVIRPGGARGAPGADEKPASAAGGEEHRYFGAPIHWNKNANFAADVDVLFLSLFPDPRPIHKRLAEGYTTLNFIPSIATMILGLMAGELLRRKYRDGVKFWILVGAGLLCLLIGLGIDHYIWPDWLASAMGWVGNTLGVNWPALSDRTWSLCPIVKRIWTPSWVIFSAGWTFLMLAAFYGIIDILGFRLWAFPLVVVGMNSIAMYCMAQLLKPWISRTLKIHLGDNVFDKTAEALGTHSALVQTTAQVLVLWLFCLWMYRRKIFIKV
jgi:predicted acyltransferase